METLKHKKYTLVILIATAFVLFAAQDFLLKNNDKSDTIEKVSIENHVFNIEVADDSEELKRGLGGRNGLCEQCGMLFDFKKVGTYAFWMKDMQFPLDIIWILDGRIVHIEKKVEPTFSRTLNPDKVADSVLEINAGTVERFGFKVGDKVNF